jgi:hypothetical protein
MRAFDAVRLSKQETLRMDGGVPPRFGCRAFADLASRQRFECRRVDGRGTAVCFCRKGTLRSHLRALKKVFGDSRGSVR